VADGHVKVGVVGLGFGAADGGEAGEVCGGEDGSVASLGEEPFTELDRGTGDVGLEVKVLACQTGLVFDDIGRAQISEVNDVSAKGAFESGIDALGECGSDIASLIDFLGQKVQVYVTPIMGEDAMVGHCVENRTRATAIRGRGRNKLGPNAIMSGQALGDDAADLFLESEVVDQHEGQVPETESAQSADRFEKGPEASEEGAGGFDEDCAGDSEGEEFRHG